MGLFEQVFNKMFRSESRNRSQEDIDFENQVRNDGYEYAGKRIADILNKKITSKDLAKQFVLEELDAARQGNDYAKNFVKNSGFKSVEYVGAINRTRWEGDESELEHLQLFLRSFLMKISDIDLMVKLSISVVDEIMQRWELGKYNFSNEDNFNTEKKLVNVVEKKYNQPEGILANINNDLNAFMTVSLLNSEDYEDKLLVMAYGYARRIAAAGLFLQGVFNREAYNQAKIVFQSLQVKTGHTIKFQEDAFSQALEYIQSYDNRINREFVSLIVATAENEDTISIYDIGQQITFERLFEIFNKSNNNNIPSIDVDEADIPF